MAYTIPQFPLLVDVFEQTTLGVFVFRMTTVGNLASGRRVFPIFGLSYGNEGVSTGSVLLVPRDTDIRDARSGLPDKVVVPNDLGCPYIVWGVSEVGAGFPNHYRRATIVPLSSGWVVPYPVIPLPPP